MPSYLAAIKGGTQVMPHTHVNPYGLKHLPSGTGSLGKLGEVVGLTQHRTWKPKPLKP